MPNDPNPTPNPTPVPASKPDPKPAPAAKKKPEPAERFTVESLRDKLATPDWLFAAARQKHAWPNGAEVTEQAYAEAVKAAANEPIGRTARKPLADKPAG